MNENLIKAIENTLAMIRTNCKADEALKFSQAALNLANTKQILEARNRTIKGAGS